VADEKRQVVDFINVIRDAEARLDRIRRMLKEENLLFAINVADYEDWGPIPLKTDYVRDKLEKEKQELARQLDTLHNKLQRILDIIRDDPR
jgi:DNA-binding transcriptional MerR regulator